MKRRLLALFLVLSIILSLCGCCILKAPIENAVAKMTTALVVGEHNISAVELNYFYVDAINKFVNQYSSYISYILDTSKPLNEQIYDMDSQQTWADHFLDQAIDSARNTYALYDAAVAAGHTLSDEEKTSMQSLYDNMDVYAEYYGYSNTNQYLAAVYGNGADMDTYKTYYEVVIMASSYYAAYAENLEDSYDDVALREFEGDEAYKYNSYTYASYYLSADKFNSELNLSRAVTILCDSDNNTVTKLNAAIQEMEMQFFDIGYSEGFSTATEYTDILYNEVPSSMQEWLSSNARKPGDITAIQYTTTSINEHGNEVEELKGCYVVLYQGMNDNKFSLANVRHILIAFEGGTTDKTTGKTTYSETEKNKAKDEAIKIYNEWLEGDKTEDSFAKLAKEKTDDSNGDQGGLYEDIYPGQMVDPFNDWCFDAVRKPGDHGAIVTQYGYHIMFYSGDSETNYRDYMVSADKLAEDMEVWQDNLYGNMTCNVQNTKFVNMEYIISSTLE